MDGAGGLGVGRRRVAAAASARHTRREPRLQEVVPLRVVLEAAGAWRVLARLPELPELPMVWAKSQARAPVPGQARGPELVLAPRLADAAAPRPGRPRSELEQAL